MKAGFSNHSVLGVFDIAGQGFISKYFLSGIDQTFLTNRFYINDFLVVPALDIVMNLIHISL